MKKYPLRIKMIWAFALFSFIPLLIVVSIFNYNIMGYSESEISKSNIDKLNLINNVMVQMSDTFMEDSLRISRNGLLDNLYGVDNYYSSQRDFNEITALSQVQDLLTDETNTNDQLYSVYLYLDNSDYVLSSDYGILSKEDFRDTGWLTAYNNWNGKKFPLYWFSRTIPTEEALQNSQSKSDSNQAIRVISYISPLTAYTTSLRGAIVFNIKESSISDTLNNKNDQSNGNIFIVDKNGNVVTHVNKSLIGSNLSQKAYMTNILKSKADSGFTVFKNNGNDQLVTYLKTDFNDYIYVGIHPMNTLLRNANLLKNRLFGCAIIVFAFAIAISVAVSRRFYHPMRELIQRIKIQKVPELDLNGDEMLLISKTFDDLIQQEEQMTSMIEKSKQNVLDSYLHDLLNGNVEDESERCLWETEMDSFFCVVMAIDNYESFQAQYIPKEAFYMLVVIMKICEEVLNDTFPCAGIVENNRIILILNVSLTTESDPYDKCAALLRKAQYEISKILDSTISFGVGNVYSRKQLIRQTYMEALNSLKYRLVKGLCSITLWRDVEVENIKYYYPYNIEKHILNALNQNSNKEIHDTVSELISNLKSKDGLSYENIIQIFYQLFGSIIKYLADSNINVMEILGGDYNFYKNIDAEESLDGIEMLFIDICDRIISYNEKNSLPQYDYVTAIFDYIGHHYHEEIDIETIAEHLCISYSYVRKVFKEKTGKSIVDYINEIRIEEAKKMLSDDGMNVKSIAISLGYNNDQSFTRIFKKMEGMTPGEFRSRRFFLHEI
jgi:AraC-like DNA-binding protein